MGIKIREAEAKDAAGMITYLEELAAEPDILVPLAPGEGRPSIEDEEEFISYMPAPTTRFCWWVWRRAAPRPSLPRE